MQLEQNERCGRGAVQSLDVVKRSYKRFGVKSRSLVGKRRRHTVIRCVEAYEHTSATAANTG